VQNFVDRLDHGAGREMREVVDSLKEVRETLDRTHANLTGSGQDVSSKLAEAAENIGQVFAQASATLGSSTSGVAGSIETAIGKVVDGLEIQSKVFAGTLATLQDQLSKQLEESTKKSIESGAAATAASHELAEAVMEELREGIGTTISSLRQDIGGL